MGELRLVAPVEERLCGLLALVPPERTQAALRQLGVRADGNTNAGYAVRVLGVRGVSDLLGVPFPEVLQRVGPEDVALADLLEPNPMARNAAPWPGCSCVPGYARNPYDESLSSTELANYETNEGFGTRYEEPTSSGGFSGMPAPVAFRPGSWARNGGPKQPLPEYMIAQGDTGAGIAGRYLGRGDRWLEILALQNMAAGQMGPNGPYLNRYTSVFEPSQIGKPGRSSNPMHWFREGAILIMPLEAWENAAEMNATGSVPPAPSPGGAPGTKPGAGSTFGVAGWSTGKKLAVGAAVLGGLAVLGGGIYYVAT